MSSRPVKTPAYQRSSERLAPRRVPAAARIRPSQQRANARNGAQRLLLCREAGASARAPARRRTRACPVHDTRRSLAWESARPAAGRGRRSSSPVRRRSSAYAASPHKERLASATRRAPRACRAWTWSSRARLGASRHADARGGRRGLPRGWLGPRRWRATRSRRHTARPVPARRRGTSSGLRSTPCSASRPPSRTARRAGASEARGPARRGGRAGHHDHLTERAAAA